MTQPITYHWVWGLALAIAIGIMIFLLYLPWVDRFLRANIPNDYARAITIAIFVAAMTYLIAGLFFRFIDVEHDCRKSRIYDDCRNFDHVRHQHCISNLGILEDYPRQ